MRPGSSHSLGDKPCEQHRPSPAPPFAAGTSPHGRRRPHRGKDFGGGSAHAPGPAALSSLTSPARCIRGPRPPASPLATRPGSGRAGPGGLQASGPRATGEQAVCALSGWGREGKGVLAPSRWFPEPVADLPRSGPAAVRCVRGGRAFPPPSRRRTRSGGRRRRRRPPLRALREESRKKERFGFGRFGVRLRGGPRQVGGRGGCWGGIRRWRGAGPRWGVRPG